jgi:hypothetical protein
VRRAPVRLLSLGLGLLLGPACLRATPPSVDHPVPAGTVVLPPLARVGAQLGFSPQTLLFDFAGDVVATDTRAPTLNALDPDALSTSQTATVPGQPSAWSGVSTRTGYGGTGYLLASHTFYSLDLDRLSATKLFAPPSAATVTGFAARRDAPGLLWTDEVGGIHVVDGDGKETLVVSGQSGEALDDVASASNGGVFAVVERNGACTGIRRVISGVPQDSLVDLGQAPCRMHISPDNSTLWVLGHTGDDLNNTQLTAVKAATGAELATPTGVVGLNATNVIVSADGLWLALVGAGPTYTVAVARVDDALKRNTVSTGDVALQQGPFRTLPSSATHVVSDGLFGEEGALFLAEPDLSRIERVH